MHVSYATDELKYRVDMGKSIRWTDVETGHLPWFASWQTFCTLMAVFHYNMHLA